MPLHFVRDDERQRFIVTLTGHVTIAEVASFVANQITLGFWRWSVLYDATAPGVTLTELPAVTMDTWRELNEEHGRRAPVAFAVADDLQRAVAERYVAAAVAAGVFRGAVFSAVPAAEAWLDAQRSDTDGPKNGNA
jgi:hypothetical protein